MGFFIIQIQHRKPPDEHLFNEIKYHRLIKHEKDNVIDQSSSEGKKLLNEI
jgi:hypothetical protein